MEENDNSFVIDLENLDDPIQRANIENLPQWLLAELLIRQLKRIQEALNYNEHLIRDAKYHLNLGHLKKMNKILKGEKNENNNG